MSVEKARFRNPVIPDCELELKDCNLMYIPDSINNSGICISSCSQDICPKPIKWSKWSDCKADIDKKDGKCYVHKTRTCTGKECDNYEACGPNMGMDDCTGEVKDCNMMFVPPGDFGTGICLSNNDCSKRMLCSDGNYNRNKIIPGDVNGDGKINVLDIVAIVNYIRKEPDFNWEKDSRE